MINFKKLPKTKKLADFELLDINLIPGQRLEFAYVMRGSNRVIQKSSLEAIRKMMQTNPFAAAYVKLGAEQGFERSDTFPEFRERMYVVLKKKVYKNTIWKLVLVVVLVLAFLIVDRSRLSELYTPTSFWILLICLLAILPGWIHFYRFKSWSEAQQIPV